MYCWTSDYAALYITLHTKFFPTLFTLVATEQLPLGGQLQLPFEGGMSETDRVQSNWERVIGDNLWTGRVTVHLNVCIKLNYQI